MSQQLIIALDQLSLEEALPVARLLKDIGCAVKVGSILFTACGPEAVRQLRGLGFDVMLDLKFFDIPSTVEASCQAAARLEASWITVHAAAGEETLRAAVRGIKQESSRLHVRPPRVLAVTLLTSVGSESADAGTSVADRVIELAKRSYACGCEGVVASAQEAALLRRSFGRKLYIVCPGIRPASAQAADHRRVATPQEALEAGADALVVGRPVTASDDPKAAALSILEQMKLGRKAC